MRPHHVARNTTIAAARPYQARGEWLFALIAFIVIFGVLLFATPRTVLSQGVALVKVDVAVVAQGHRASKLIGSGVVNDKNEKVGSLDDIIIARDRKVMFAVLQVGGFLGVGGRLVAIPYESLQIADDGKITLPGATKEELQKLAEFKHRT
jgi:sporulation protein YlmC with PRC-barrel domain